MSRVRSIIKLFSNTIVLDREQLFEVAGDGRFGAALATEGEEQDDDEEEGEPAAVRSRHYFRAVSFCCCSRRRYRVIGSMSQRIKDLRVRTQFFFFFFFCP